MTSWVPPRGGCRGAASHKHAGPSMRENGARSGHEGLPSGPWGGEHMSANGHSTPAQIRSHLNHPVIDGDGHWVEFDPVFSERMRKVGGDKAGDGFLAAMKTTRDALSMSVAERRRRRIAQPGFWSRQAENTLDRATAMMPRLLYQRLDEFGCDFAV